MATQRKRKVELTPEGEALLREALEQADAIQAQYEESKRLEAEGKKGLYIRWGSPEEIRRQLRGG